MSLDVAWANYVDNREIASARKCDVSAYPAGVALSDQGSDLRIARSTGVCHPTDMPALDFREIPPADAGPERDAFELFAREVLIHLGYEVAEGPDRGPDGGRDLILNEVRTGVGGATVVRWLVSSKHYAHSGRAVGEPDEQNIVDRMRAHECQGFIGFYSTLPSSALRTRVVNLRIEHQFYDPARIETLLLESSDGIALARRYCPASMQAWEGETPRPADLFSAPTSLKCAHCERELLAGGPQGIIVIWRRLIPEHHVEGPAIRVYCACKGDCDRALRETYRTPGTLDGWEDVTDLTIPTVFIHWVMSFVNQLHRGREFEPEAFDAIKEITLAVAPHVLRNHTTAEREQVKRLGKIPMWLGGLGG